MRQRPSTSSANLVWLWVITGLYVACAERRPGERNPETIGRAASRARQLRHIAAREQQRADPDDWVAGQLTDADPQVRARAALALGRIDHRHALKPLTIALSDQAARCGAAPHSRYACICWTARSPRAPGAPGNLSSPHSRSRQSRERAPPSCRPWGWVGRDYDYIHLREALGGSNALAATTAWGLLARGLRDDAQRKPGFAAAVPTNDALCVPLAADRRELRRAAAWAAAQQPWTVCHPASSARSRSAQQTIRTRGSAPGVFERSGVRIHSSDYAGSCNA
jgi:hypothetical protein